MGDRANIKLTGTDLPALYLYSHWAGTELPVTLQKALEHGKGRWGDEAYLNRIIIDQVFADLRDGETGGGISTFLEDGNDRIVEVDTSLYEGKVTLNGKNYTFAEYLALENPTW